jgi:heme A synthase
MVILKWIGYVLLSVAGLSLAGGFLAFILTASAVIAAVALAAVVLLFTVFCIKEYFEGPEETKTTHKDIEG